MARQQRGDDVGNQDITDRSSGNSNHGRRSFMKLVGATAAAAGLGYSGTNDATAATSGPFSHVESIVLEGGYPDTITRDDATVVVSSASEFIDAVGSASSGDVVFVAGDAEIDLSGKGGIDVPGGVTIASNRSASGAAGGMLYTDVKEVPLLQTAGEGVRLTGLRFRGNHPEGYHEFTEWDESASGFLVQHTGAEVDNCEIYGWGYAGVVAKADGCHVHHCHIHRNEEDGLGYGVHCRYGHTIIEFNYFLHNRHAIAGGGDSAGYTARYNLVGPEGEDHAFDMHRPGGNRIEIHHNKFEYKETIHGSPIEAVKIRGVPNDVCKVHDNWFHHESPPGDQPVTEDGEAINQSDSDGEWQNLTFSSNYYGPNATPDYGSSLLEQEDPVVTTASATTDSTDDSTTSTRTFEIETAPDSGSVTYEFTVDGELAQAPDDVENNDNVTDNGDGTWTATGFSGNGYSDVYEFSGAILEFTASPAAMVTLYDDGADVTDDVISSDMTHAIRFDGDGSTTRSTYSFEVTDTVTAGPGTTLEDADVISGGRVEGTLVGGIDVYHFTGDLRSFNFDGSVTVSVEELN